MIKRKTHSEQYFFFQEKTQSKKVPCIKNLPKLGTSPKVMPESTGSTASQTISQSLTPPLQLSKKPFRLTKRKKQNSDDLQIDLDHFAYTKFKKEEIVCSRAFVNAQHPYWFIDRLSEELSYIGEDKKGLLESLGCTPRTLKRSSFPVWLDSMKSKVSETKTKTFFN